MTLIPKQLAVCQRLVSHLEAINPEATDPRTGEAFDYDFRNKVFIGRTTLGLETEMPALALLEAPQPADVKPADNERVERSESWTLLLQGFAVDDKKNPTVPAYMLKAAVEVQLSRLVAENDRGKPVFPDEFHLGKLVAGLTIGQGVVRPPSEKVSKTGYFYIPLIFDIVTNVSQPYVEVP